MMLFRSQEQSITANYNSGNEIPLLCIEYTNVQKGFLYGKTYYEHPHQCRHHVLVFHRLSGRADSPCFLPESGPGGGGRRDYAYLYSDGIRGRNHHQSVSQPDTGNQVACICGLGVLSVFFCYFIDMWRENSVGEFNNLSDDSVFDFQYGGGRVYSGVHEKEKNVEIIKNYVVD